MPIDRVDRVIRSKLNAMKNTDKDVPSYHKDYQRTIQEDIYKLGQFSKIIRVCTVHDMNTIKVNFVVPHVAKFATMDPILQ